MPRWFAKRYPQITPNIQNRLDYEFSVIKKMGFAGYFLITMDFVKYAKTNLIPVGPGRGSAAGSIVAYTTGITDVDPIKYNLLFERFLNPDRISMPDIDIDFCIEGRQKVIDYIKNLYGENLSSTDYYIWNYESKICCKRCRSCFRYAFW